ncbi:MAG: small basic family protein [Armatimonadetes bacterium]|nr:small basic family protein [Armatimonadota bacterium]
MILVPILAMIVGIVLGFVINTPVKGDVALYLGVAVLGGLDSVCGGSRSGLEGKFRTDVFITGFFANIAIAVFLVWLGSRISVNLYLVAAFVFGTRIFNNLSLLRRMALTKWQDARQRKAVESEVATQQGQQAQQTPL